ncbi:MAG TPA: TolC family protein [Steroidobacteraceae bacterium]
MRRALAACLLCLGAGSAAAAPASEAAADPEPLTLAQAHALALRNHPEVAEADYQAQAQHEVYVQSRAGLLPQVNLYADAVHAGADDTRLLAGGINNPSVFSRTAVGVGASQLITDFGHTSNLAASSRLQAGAAQQAALTARAQVLLAVDRDYFAALQAEAVEAVARQTLETRQLLLERVSILAQNKLKSDLDVSFAQVGTEDARLLVQRARSDADSAQATLAVALGYREARTFVLTDQSTDAASAEQPAAALVEQALQDRPELASLRNQRDAAEKLALSLRDARLPTVSAVIDAGTAPTHDARLPDNYSAAGILVSVPLFAGGLYSARQHEAELRARAAAEALRKVEDEVARDVRVAVLTLNNARERLRTSGQLKRYATTAYELADARYRAGSSSIVELSQAQLALTTAQLEETAARYEVLGRAAELAYQSGATADAAALAPGG